MRAKMHLMKADYHQGSADDCCCCCYTNMFKIKIQYNIIQAESIREEEQ